MASDNLTLRVISLYVSKTRGTGSVPVSEIQLRPNYGIVGDRHTGETRVRSTGEVVENLRHFTAVTPYELGATAEALGVPFIDPSWLRANICFACPATVHFTKTLRAGTKLLNAEGRAVLEVKWVTEPCLEAGKYIAEQFPYLAVDARFFPKAAHGRRGIYGIALEDTTIRVNDTFSVLLFE